MGMSKKKKKKKDFSVLAEVDGVLTDTYEELMKDIKEMQAKLAVADVKAKKKLKKYNKKHPNDPRLYNNDTFRIHVRNEVLKDMNQSNFLDRVYKTLQDLVPVVTVIARLVASLILSILSVDAVKIHIKPNMLEKLTLVYNTAMAIG